MYDLVEAARKHDHQSNKCSKHFTSVTVKSQHAYNIHLSSCLENSELVVHSIMAQW